ncbi:hypothetical protein OG252_04645 [Streptomyces sp. NBC_01352]|uniref:hypothetical protein n=1 Tax=Streptomyces sp. NBC_01352 TaxID=2903834 RepID=UPI002E31252F|nr:hypothetical protein [Streptomyces sp. NBC_01352]
MVTAVFDEPGLQVGGLAMGALDLHGRTVGQAGTAVLLRRSELLARIDGWLSAPAA